MLQHKAAAVDCRAVHSDAYTETPSGPMPIGTRSTVTPCVIFADALLSGSSHSGLAATWAMNTSSGPSYAITCPYSNHVCEPVDAISLGRAVFALLSVCPA